MRKLNGKVTEKGKKMSRYIDIGKLIDELNRREIEHRADIDEVIMTTPTEDVEPVVRCKDCKHWGSSIYNHRCSLLSGLDYGLYTQENDYCSYGERKEDE